MPKFDNKEIKVIGVGEVVPVYSKETVDKYISNIMEQIKAEIKVEYDREAQNHDSFDEYSEGRYDAFGFCLRTLDKHISGK